MVNDLDRLDGRSQGPNLIEMLVYSIHSCVEEYTAYATAQ